MEANSWPLTQPWGRARRPNTNAHAQLTSVMYENTTTSRRISSSRGISRGAMHQRTEHATGDDEERLFDEELSDHFVMRVTRERSRPRRRPQRPEALAKLARSSRRTKITCKPLSHARILFAILPDSRNTDLPRNGG
jgi:hypothetical protein